MLLLVALLLTQDTVILRSKRHILLHHHGFQSEEDNVKIAFWTVNMDFGGWQNYI